MPRILENDLDKFKRETSILHVMESYGVLAERQGTRYMARCPFHEDSTPSLSVDPQKNLWHCFGCEAGGSVIDFVMKKESLTFKEATEKLLLNGGPLRRASDFIAPPKPKKLDAVPALLPDERRHVIDVIEHYHRTLSGDDSKGLDYLRKRHIADPETLKTFKVGYCNGTLKKVLPAAAVKTLKGIGLLRADGTETFQGCIVIPVFTPDGVLGECFARFIVDRKPTNHLYLPGQHRGVLNAKAAEIYEDIILTEAAFDALTFYSHGVKNVIPCYGTGGFTEDHCSVLKNTHRVFFAFDNDQAGEDGSKRLAEKLVAQGVECHRIHVPPELGKDINEYVSSMYRNGMKPEEVTAALKDLVAKAKRFAFHREKTAKLKLADSGNPDDLVFQNCELTYRLRGLYENPGNSLRVILTAAREGVAHTDRFDLYTAKSRTGFAYRAGARLDLMPAKIEEDMSVLIPMLETLLTEGKGNADNKQSPPPMTGEEREEALRLLRSKDLMKRISADLEIIGYVGEDRNKQLTYLVATSRKLDKPLSAIIRSESGAGKSYLMECVAELMPPEDVKYFSRLTPQSLYYMGKDELVHKLLIVDERDGSEEAEYPIRTLQTRRILTLAVPMKDASTGKIKTVMLEILGPIAYMESSTQTTINPENLNRCFEIYLDESEEQTKKIYALQKQAHTPEGWKVDATKESTIRRHRNAQRLLAPVRVSIPFTGNVKFPASWTRGRRDHQRLLHLIEAVAFLHQAQREKKKTADGEEYVEATVDDYAQAYALARTAFAQALGDIPRNARLVLSHIRAMVKDASERLNLSERDYGFRRRDVREFARLPDHQVKRAMRTLEELEYIHVKRGGRGGSFVYRLAADPREKDPLEGLTTPEELRKVEQKWNKGVVPLLAEVK